MSHTLDDLRQRQALSLNLKIQMTKTRIREWVNHFGKDNVYISFSGGKDSLVLLDIARSMYPDMKAVFVNTGLEYPSIVNFVKSFDNVDIIKPKMSFYQVLCKYGYPAISKEVSECAFGARKYLHSIQKELHIKHNKHLTGNVDAETLDSKQASKQASKAKL